MIPNLKYNEPDNDWANDIKDNPIHISQAESGAKGYYCMGCTKEMQAVKFKNIKHQSYFRHHIKDVDTTKVECVHASKEYREKLAYFYFMRVKQIKVPAVYKYPPKGEKGIPNLIQEATTITAHRIERELTFYENEDGEIKWGKNPEIDERYLLVRPDAVFFDKNDKPILFLEFVITHKPDIDKLNKLKRLGINTVQIIVPKLPEAELEKSISSASKVKWTYHEIESDTDYISTPSGDTEGIPSIDEEQRKLFEESYKCRTAQIGNLIRGIKRCLESQSYRRTERLFEQEISRIEKATSEHQSRLDKRQRDIEEEIHSEFKQRRRDLEDKNREFQLNCKDLEERYLTKRDLLKEEQRDVDRDIELRHRVGKTKDDIRAEFERIEDDIRRKFERTEREYIYEDRDIESRHEVIRSRRERVNGDIEENISIENNFGRAEEDLRTEFERLEESEHKIFENEIANFESKIERIRELQNQEESGIRGEFEGRYQQIIKRINDRDVQSGDELSARIRTILALRGLLDSYAIETETLKRCREGIKIIRNGTWKEWDK